ncbi:MAG: thioredoxin family protein [Acidobacteriota bacterium]
MKEIELFYGLTCPYCRTARRLLKKIVEENPERFNLKQTLISSPKGLIRRYKLGVHAVPAILIDGEIIFRSLPEEGELRKKLNII